MYWYVAGCCRVLQCFPCQDIDNTFCIWMLYILRINTSCIHTHTYQNALHIYACYYILHIRNAYYESICSICVWNEYWSMYVNYELMQTHHKRYAYHVLVGPLTVYKRRHTTRNTQHILDSPQVSRFWREFLCLCVLYIDIYTHTHTPTHTPTHTRIKSRFWREFLCWNVMCVSVLRCIAVCCSVSQGVADVAVCSSVFQFCTLTKFSAFACTVNIVYIRMRINMYYMQTNRQTAFS